MESNFFNLIETIYKKHTVNIILNGEKLSFPAKIKYKAKMSHNSTPLQHRSIVKVLTNAVRWEMEIKCIHIWKEEIKLPLLAHDMIILKFKKINQKKKSPPKINEPLE